MANKLCQGDAPVKVHHVLDNLEIGGAETLVVTLCDALRRKGWEPHVHGIHGGGPLERNLARDGTPCHVHSARHAAAAIARLAYSFVRLRPDVVHCHNINATVLGTIAARVSGVKAVISTRHGLGHKLKPERRFWRVARFCSKVVAVSEAAQQHIGASPAADRSKLTVIYNGAGVPDAGAEGEPAPSRTGFRFISVGRMAALKNFPLLVRAFAEARQAQPGLELWIAGDGADRPAVEAAIRETGTAGAVRLLGMRRNMGFWYAHSDAFVLASRSEGLPMTLLEAMAAGLPAVVSDVGGMPEVVRKSGAGVVVPAGDVKALAAAMADMAGRQGEGMERLRQAAREAYEKSFTVERMADQYVALYGEALGSGDRQQALGGTA